MENLSPESVGAVMDRLAKIERMTRKSALAFAAIDAAILLMLAAVIILVVWR